MLVEDLPGWAGRWESAGRLSTVPNSDSAAACWVVHLGHEHEGAPACSLLARHPNRDSETSQHKCTPVHRASSRGLGERCRTLGRVQGHRQLQRPQAPGQLAAHAQFKWAFCGLLAYLPKKQCEAP